MATRESLVELEIAAETLASTAFLVLPNIICATITLWKHGKRFLFGIFKRSASAVLSVINNNNDRQQ